MDWRNAYLENYNGPTRKRISKARLSRFAADLGNRQHIVTQINDRAMRHYVSVDPTPLSEKPAHGQVGLIKSRFTDGEIDSVQDFVDVVGQGYSWSGATFTQAHLANSNFQQSSVLALDFDGEGALTPKQAIDRIQKYQISPSCWYPSFSDDPQGVRKFRLVFFLDTAITDRGAHRALMNLLLKLYPEADRSARDPARFFYGSQSPGVVVSPEEIPLEDLYTALSAHAVAGKPLQQNGRKSKGGKTLQNITAAASTTSTYNSECHDSTMAKRRYERLKENLRSKNVDWDKLAERVTLFDQFMNGNRRLKYSQLEFIASNLAWMRGGAAVYRDRLEEFNQTHGSEVPGGLYERDGRFELLRDFRQRNKKLETCYFPMNLANDKAMAPEQDLRYKNLITAERDQVKGVRVTEPVQRMSLPQAEQLFAHKFRQVMDGMDTNIHVFRVHTALGKTRAIQDAGPNTLLCFPTHDLKEEVAERRRDKHNFVVTPKLPRFDSMRLNNELAKLYELGFNRQAHQLLIRVSRGDTDEHYGMGDRRAAEEYITKKRELYVTDKTILATHDWATHSARKISQIDTLVFDEDPLSALAPIDDVKISELAKMASSSGETLFPWKHDYTLKDVVTYLLELEDEEVTTLPSKYELDIDQWATAYSQIEGLSSNVKEFLECDYLMKDGDTVHFISQHPLPNDRKVVILSASAHVHFYREIYGDRVRVHDISDIQMEGAVEQHMHRSYSRVSLKNALQEAKDLQDGSPVITFKTMKDEFGDADPQCHFGNTSGYDHLKGEDTKVIGTPYPHNSKVFLLGAILGIPVRHPRNREFGRKNVEFNGLEFNFSTFTSNDRLSNIQLELIHADLCQAAGRSRTLREDCTCQVYSNFPLRIATKYHY